MPENTNQQQDAPQPESRSALNTITAKLQDENATAALAGVVADWLRRGDMVALYGDLGAGKTSFCRALISALAGTPQEVPSPTFTLVQTYDVRPATVWHFDLYRLSGMDEMYELGWDDARSDGITLVEWPDRLEDLLPEDRLDINLTFGNDGETVRYALLTFHGEWAARLKDMKT